MVWFLLKCFDLMLEVGLIFLFLIFVEKISSNLKFEYDTETIHDNLFLSLFRLVSYCIFVNY